MTKDINKQILDGLNIDSKEVKTIARDVMIKDLIKILEGLNADSIIIKDLNDQVWTEDLTLIQKNSGEVELILPFTTNGNHEWREDIAEEFYK